MKKTSRIDSKLPAATMTQRLAAMSETQLMDAARQLATRPDGDRACTAVLDELERRVPGPSFDAFVAEVYS